MGKGHDVVVVGGGVMGASVAFHCAKKGAKVIVLERDFMAGATTRASAGMLSAQEGSLETHDMLEANVASRDLFAALVPEVESLSRTTVDYEVCGLWRVVETDAEKKALAPEVAFQQAHGHPVEWWDAGSLARDFKALRPPYLGAYCFSKDAQVDSERWLEGLRRAAEVLGAEWRFSSNVTSFKRQGARVMGVDTSAGPVAADRVVVTAGVWSAKLVPEQAAAWALHPVKGETLCATGSRDLLPGPVLTSQGYAAPKKSGRVVFGTTLQPDVWDMRPTRGAQQTVTQWVERWTPSLKNLPLEIQWAGLRPCSGSGRPVAGPVPGTDNLFVCAGHYRGGILLSALYGRDMAAQLVEGQTLRGAD